MKKILCILMVMISVFIFSCQTTSVERTSADTQIDLSGRWNDTDSRLVAEKMVKSMFDFPWINDFTDDQDRKPVLIVGSVRNKSSEHIETSTFIKDIERECIKSGLVKFVATKHQQGELRDEKVDQASNASEDTAKALAAETGADFMLVGLFTTQVDAVDGKKVVLYKVDMELIDIQSNEKVWIETKEIKKFIERKKASW